MERLRLLMKRWSLNFSGVRGSDAEAFLICIEEGRALIPVSDENLFKNLPFFYREQLCIDFRIANLSGASSSTRSVLILVIQIFNSRCATRLCAVRKANMNLLLIFSRVYRLFVDRLNPPWNLEE